MWVIERVAAGQRNRARNLFNLFSEVFAENQRPISDAYIDRLLQRDSFWAFAAVEEDRVIGGLTAHVLPMTNAECAELLIYDIAVAEKYQRRGIGQQLIEAVRSEAALRGIEVVFVLAVNEDIHALRFYRKLRAAASPVTLFEWSRQ